MGGPSSSPFDTMPALDGHESGGLGVRIMGRSSLPSVAPPQCKSTSTAASESGSSDFTVNHSAWKTELNDVVRLWNNTSEAALKNLCHPLANKPLPEGSTGLSPRAAVQVRRMIFNSLFKVFDLTAPEWSAQLGSSFSHLESVFHALGDEVAKVDAGLTEVRARACTQDQLQQQVRTMQEDLFDILYVELRKRLSHHSGNTLSQAQSTEINPYSSAWASNTEERIQALENDWIAQWSKLKSAQSQALEEIKAQALERANMFKAWEETGMPRDEAAAIKADLFQELQMKMLPEQEDRVRTQVQADMLAHVRSEIKVWDAREERDQLRSSMQEVHRLVDDMRKSLSEEVRSSYATVIRNTRHSVEEMLRFSLAHETKDLILDQVRAAVQAEREALQGQRQAQPALASSGTSTAPETCVSLKTESSAMAAQMGAGSPQGEEKQLAPHLFSSSVISHRIPSDTQVVPSSPGSSALQPDRCPLPSTSASEPAFAPTSAPPVSAPPASAPASESTPTSAVPALPPATALPSPPARASTPSAFAPSTPARANGRAGSEESMDISDAASFAAPSPKPDSSVRRNAKAQSTMATPPKPAQVAGLPGTEDAQEKDKDSSSLKRDEPGDIIEPYQSVAGAARDANDKNFGLGPLASTDDAREWLHLQEKALTIFPPAVRLKAVVQALPHVTASQWAAKLYQAFEQEDSELTWDDFTQLFLERFAEETSVKWPLSRAPVLSSSTNSVPCTAGDSSTSAGKAGRDEPGNIGGKGSPRPPRSTSPPKTLDDSNPLGPRLSTPPPVSSYRLGLEGQLKRVPPDPCPADTAARSSDSRSQAEHRSQGGSSVLPSLSPRRNRPHASLPSLQAPTRPPLEGLTKSTDGLRTTQTNQSENVFPDSNRKVQSSSPVSQSEDSPESSNMGTPPGHRRRSALGLHTVESRLHVPLRNRGKELLRFAPEQSLTLSHSPQLPPGVSLGSPDTPMPQTSHVPASQHHPSSGSMKSDPAADCSHLTPPDPRPRPAPKRRSFTPTDPRPRPASTARIRGTEPTISTDRQQRRDDFIMGARISPPLPFPPPLTNPSLAPAPPDPQRRAKRHLPDLPEEGGVPKDPKKEPNKKPNLEPNKKPNKKPNKEPNKEPEEEDLEETQEQGLRPWWGKRRRVA